MPAEARARNKCLSIPALRRENASIPNESSIARLRQPVSYLGVHAIRSAVGEERVSGDTWGFVYCHRNSLTVEESWKISELKGN